MDNEKDSLPWITVFPDYPRAFAWFLPPCDESDLGSYVGPCCGVLLPDENRGSFGDEELPTWLSMRFCAWMDKWEELDLSDRLSDEESNISNEEQAIDNEGIELTRELKTLYGDKYRFRYSFAWRYDDKDWIVV